MHPTELSRAAGQGGVAIAMWRAGDSARWAKPVPQEKQGTACLKSSGEVETGTPVVDASLGIRVGLPNQVSGGARHESHAPLEGWRVDHVVTDDFACRQACICDAAAAEKAQFAGLPLRRGARRRPSSVGAATKPS